MREGETEDKIQSRLYIALTANDVLRMGLGTAQGADDFCTRSSNVILFGRESGCKEIDERSQPYVILTT